MSGKTHSIGVFLTYTAIVIAVLYWSGRVSEKTLYDKYIISLDGTAMPITDKNGAARFYSQVLNFDPIWKEDEQSEQKSIIGFELPGKRHIVLDFSDDQPPRARQIYSVMPVIRVRNGFDKLHAELVRRSASPAQPVAHGNHFQVLPPATVSEVFDGPLGSEFVVTDLDGNRLLFYRRHRRIFKKKS